MPEVLSYLVISAQKDSKHDSSGPGIQKAHSLSVYFLKLPDTILINGFSKYVVVSSVVDPDPVGSTSFWRIGIGYPRLADAEPDSYPFYLNVKLNNTCI